MTCKENSLNCVKKVNKKNLLHFICSLYGGYGAFGKKNASHLSCDIQNLTRRSVTFVGQVKYKRENKRL